MTALRLAAVATVLLAAGLAFWLAPLSPNVLVLQFAFTPPSFGAVIHVWPAEHLARYRAHLPVDGLLLLAYGSWGYLLATRSAAFAALPARLAAAARYLLPLAAACDAAENLLHAWLTAAPRFGMPLPYALAGSSAALKWLLLFAFGILLLLALTRDAADEPRA